MSMTKNEKVFIRKDFKQNFQKFLVIKLKLIGNFREQRFQKK